MKLTKRFSVLFLIAMLFTIPDLDAMDLSRKMTKRERYERNKCLQLQDPSYDWAKDRMACLQQLFVSNQDKNSYLNFLPIEILKEVIDLVGFPEKNIGPPEKKRRKWSIYKVIKGDNSQKLLNQAKELNEGYNALKKKLKERNKSIHQNSRNSIDLKTVSVYEEPPFLVQPKSKISNRFSIFTWS